MLNAVSEETDVTAQKIVSKCSEMEVVDARWIAAKLLREEGFYPSRIAELMGVTPRYVQYILTDFGDRVAVSPMMRKNYERARKRLRMLTEGTDWL